MKGSGRKKKEATKHLFEEAAEGLRVLAHPHRLGIVEFLEMEGIAPVHRIESHIGLSQAATSMHLTRMRRVGLVRAERRGKEIWYHVADNRALTILDCLRAKRGQREKA